MALRRARLETWRSQGIEPFGAAFPGTESCRQVVDNYADERPVRIAGRLISKREMGKNVFAHIQDETGKLQVYAGPDHPHSAQKPETLELPQARRAG